VGEDRCRAIVKLRDLVDVDDCFGFIRRAIIDDREGWEVVDRIADADGVGFLCPKCFKTNGGRVGTHAVVCWRPRVPPDVDPKPGRWEFVGTGLDDLTLVAGSSSVLLSGPCGAHFHVRGGAIEGE
jgi:hypothetical protein